MRHGKDTFKLNRNSSHRKALIANLLKSLIEHGRIETTVAKAKRLRRAADKMITIAKKDSIDARRKARAKLSLRYNKLNSKQKRAAKTGDLSAYNADRVLLKKLFEELAPKYKERHGGYTRIIRTEARRGDSTEKCYIEYV